MPENCEIDILKQTEINFQRRAFPSVHMTCDE